MKFIPSLVVALLVAANAGAQSHLVESFLAVKSLQVSNVAAVTNILMYPGQSNIFGGRWTNNAGTAVNVTTAGNTTQLLKDCPLWADRDGNIPVRQFSSVPGTQTNYNYASAFTISGKLIGGALANQSVTFVFTPYWKDTAAGETPFIATTHDFSFAVTGASGIVTFATNITMIPYWAGAKGVRVRSIVNGDTDYTGGVYITDLDLSGYRP